MSDETTYDIHTANCVFNWDEWHEKAVAWHEWLAHGTLVNEQIPHEPQVNTVHVRALLERLSQLTARLANEWRDPMDEKPPIQQFISGQGWTPKAYVLAVDVKGRVSVGYATQNRSGGYRWAFAKPIGEPVLWMPLPPLPVKFPHEKDLELTGK